MASDLRDLGKWFGVKQTPSFDITNPMRVGTDMGFSIATCEDKFSHAVDFYRTEMSMSNAQILDRCFLTIAYDEAVMYGATVLGPREAKNFPIYIPSGRWYYNSELRSGQHANIASGNTFNSGNGGTELREYRPGYISKYGHTSTYMGFVPWNYTGELNNATFPVGLDGGFEWCHHFQVRGIRMNGQCPTTFYDPGVKSIAVMYYNPGERSGIYDCEFDDYNDGAVMISHTPAPATIENCSFFRNRVAMVLIRGCARSSISINGMSGDFTPYAIHVFRGGQSLYGGSYWPHAIASNPGGTISARHIKLEDSNCRNGYLGHTGCTPSMFTGKGTMLARLTGRFQFSLDGLTASNYFGKTDSLIEVIDDFQAGFTIPLSNSSISLKNIQTIKYAHWLHDMSANEKYQLNELDTDTQRTSFKWAKNDPLQKGIVPETGAFYPVTPASYDGTQPYINQGQLWNWNHNAAPGAGQNYHRVTGVNY